MDDAHGAPPGSIQPMRSEAWQVARALLARTHDIVIALDASGNFCFANDTVSELLGYEASTLIGRSVLDFAAAEDMQNIADAMNRWEGRGGRPRGGNVGIRASDGTVRQFHYRAGFGDELVGPGSFIVTLNPLNPEASGDDMIPALVENANRVSRIAAGFLGKSSADFARGFDNAISELSGLEWITRITAWTLKEGRLIRSARWDASISAPTQEPPASLRIDTSPMLRRLISGREVLMSTVSDSDPELADERASFESSGDLSVLAEPLVAGNRVFGILLLESTVADVSIDVAHLATLRSAAAIIAAAMMGQEAERELAEKARIDPTTGLSNRWAAHSDLQAALDGLANGRSGGVGVVGLDLDRFRLVNEALGHHSGDQLLREVAARLRSTAPAGAALARLSADEFLVVLPNVSTEVQVIAAARKILEVFDVPFQVAGSTLSLTAGAGVFHHAAGPTTVPTAEEVLRQVDNIVDRAKRSGERIETGDGSNDSQLRRLRRIAELEHGLDDGDLVPYFQAEWDLSTERIIGAEALVRWDHPVDGIVGADETIPLAESAGLISRLGRQVLTQACRTALEWVEQVDGFMLRVNVSARQLRTDDFVYEVAGILEDTGFPAGSLCLELTESSLLDDPTRSREHFAHLRELGVALAIDDFGTGFSSILQLKELPLSSLKIDQHFVAGVADDPSDRAIVEATLELARAFGVTATAEGVEYEAQRRALEAMGCTRVQGFLFSKPEPAADLSERLKR